MARSKNEETGQIVIRPPAGMRDRIKAAAEANNRSMNAEIVATLEEKYPAPKFSIVNVLGSAAVQNVFYAKTTSERLKLIEKANKWFEASGLPCQIQLDQGELRLNLGKDFSKELADLPNGAEIAIPIIVRPSDE